MKIVQESMNLDPRSGQFASNVQTYRPTLFTDPVLSPGHRADVGARNLCPQEQVDRGSRAVEDEEARGAATKAAGPQPLLGSSFAVAQAYQCKEYSSISLTRFCVCSPRPSTSSHTSTRRSFHGRRKRSVTKALNRALGASSDSILGILGFRSSGRVGVCREVSPVVAPSAWGH